jgi:hypothetical protein
MITEGATPNTSGEYIALCPECDKKKLFVKCSEGDYGVFFCQACEYKGSGEDFEERFTPPSEEQDVYKAFHEYSVRKLLGNQEALDDLFERDFNEDDIKEFGFGYVGKTFIADLVKGGVSKAKLKEYGFINKNDQPVFWNHLIIPYRNGSQYINFKGRCLDENAKVKYIGLFGRDATIYASANLKKSGRVFLTEGEFKACYLKANGFNAAGVSGANNSGRYIPSLRKVDDLWIILDSDQPTDKHPIGVGQAAAIRIAEQLDRCHVVTLPLSDEDKVGVDDYLRNHGSEEFEALLASADYYLDGVKQKSRSLAIAVEDWREAAKLADDETNINIGYERMNDWLDGGLELGTVGYIIGSPHNGKSTLERAMLYHAYHLNEEVIIDHYTNDDSLRATLGRIVAMAGELDSSDAKKPMIAYANDKKMMKRWENAVAKVAGMNDRMTILDRSYRVTLEEMYEELFNWRQANPDTPRLLSIDGMRQQLCRACKGITDKMIQIEVKSSWLKRIAQECNVAVLATIEPPKLYGKRPRSFDIAFGNAGEFDADYIFTAYIEAHTKGLSNTELKIKLDYEDYPSVDAPYIEIGLVKNKPADYLNTDVMIIDPRTSRLEEVSDDEHRHALRAIQESQSKEPK